MALPTFGILAWRINGHEGVSFYAGIDSDPTWIAMARDNDDSSYRYCLADVGKTQAWSCPDKALAKQVRSSQLAPLISEPLPCHVCMARGYFRFSGVLSFLEWMLRWITWRLDNVEIGQRIGSPDSTE